MRLIRKFERGCRSTGKMSVVFVEPEARNNSHSILVNAEWPRFLAHPIEVRGVRRELMVE